MLFPNAVSLCKRNQKRIVSAENGRQHIAINSDNCSVYQYKIDGGIVSGTSKRRCDYIVENETKLSAYIIELKGTDLTHAVEQIESTLILFSDHLKKYAVFPRIVYRSNTHALNSTKVIKFQKKYGKRAKIETNSIEESI